MSIINSLIACPDIQASLDAYFMNFNPSFVKEGLGFLEFVASPLNRGGLQQTISPGDAKIRTAVVRYKPRLLESEVSTSAVKACSSTVQRGFKTATYDLDIDTGVEINEFFKVKDLAPICQSNPNYINENILMNMDVLKRRMATIIMTKAAGLVGAFNDDEENVTADVKQIQTKKADGTPDINGVEDVEFSLRNIGYPGNPILFGWGEPSQYYRRLQAGCCANSGLDLGAMLAMNNYAFIADRRVPGAFGSNNFFAIAPGAVQLLYYNEFMGTNGIEVFNDDAYKQTVIYDPETGIPFDLIFKNDCGDLHYQMKLAFDLVGMPTDMFDEADRLSGVTFVNQFEVVNP